MLFGFLRFLFWSAVGLVLLIPLGVLLLTIGLPIALVMCVLALPVLAVLAVVGLPILIVFGVAGALIAAVFGVLAGFLAIGALAIKLAVIVLVPLLILGWIARWLTGAHGARVHVD